MAFHQNRHHRKLTFKPYFFNACLENYNYPPVIPPPPPPPQPPLPTDWPPHDGEDTNRDLNKTQKILIISLPIVAACFIIFCCYVIYSKCCNTSSSSRIRRIRRRRSGRSEILGQNNQIHDDFLDEDHGPVIDHPIWYIQTIGLQPSVISSISVVKYSKGNGLIEGTDCSICLSEFQEDEDLRLLPKCSHAFHIPCIDTWLRSHQNCPVCRAPIIVATATDMDLPSSSLESSNDELTELSDLEEDGGVEDGVVVLGIQEEESGVFHENENEKQEQPMRRTVSLDLDSLSALKINGTSNGSDSRTVRREASSSSSSSTRIVQNQGLLRLMSGSSIGSLKRSLSCSGKFLLPRCSR